MAQARRAPSRRATDRHPPRHRGRGRRSALAMASAAPASTAVGRRTRTGRPARRRPEPAEDRQQRDPEREREPRPGRPLEAEVVGIADREDDAREGRVAGPDGSGQDAARTPRRSRPRPRHRARHETGRDRLARLAAGIVGRVDEVVERPDRGLQEGHRDPEPERGRAIGTGDRRDDGHHEAVEQARERMGEPDQAADARQPAGDRRPARQT